MTIPFGKSRAHPHDPVVIGFIGRFSPEKGPREFIQCAIGLHDSCPSVVFKMVGDGPLLRECKDFARQSGIPVEFTGTTSSIADELASIDIVAVTSVKDAFNMVIVEAMASGVPVAAYPVGGIPEIITNNVTGLLSELKSPESLEISIERILREKNLYAKLSSNAHIHARKNYGLNEYRKKWEDVFLSANSSFAKAAV